MVKMCIFYFIMAVIFNIACFASLYGNSEHKLHDASFYLAMTLVSIAFFLYQKGKMSAANL